MYSKRNLRFSSFLFPGILTLILFAVLSVFLLWPENKQAEKLRTVDWNAVSDSPEKVLHLSWMGVPGTPNAKQGTFQQKQLERLFSVRLTPIFLDYNAYSKRKPLMFCAGKIPDVFWEGDPVQVRKGVENGFILEVPRSLIERYAPDYAKALNRYAPKGWLYSQYHGRNYGVPTFAAGTAYPGAYVWRKDWLENVGIRKIPETIEEMEEAFRAFKNKDPDRNGVDDTYGVSPIAHWSLMFSGIFASFGVLPFDFIRKDGLVVWGGITPEAREALTILRKWYAEGFIDPDFMLNNEINRIHEKKFIAGKTGCLEAGASAELLKEPPAGFLAAALTGNFPNAIPAIGKPLLGKDGKRRGRIWGHAAHTICFGSHLAKEPEKVIRVLKILNEIAKNRDLYLEMRLGERGRVWNYRKDGSTEFLPAYTDPRTREREAVHRNGISSAYSFFAPCSLDPNRLNAVLPPEVRTMNEHYTRSEWGMENVIGKNDILLSAGGILADLVQMQLVVYMEIINGKRPLSAFETFRKEWLARGGKTMTDEASEIDRGSGSHDIQ